MWQPLSLDWKNRWNKNYLLQEIKHNYLMSEKHKKVCKALNYLEQFFIFISAVNGYFLFSFLLSMDVFSIVPCIT